VQISELTQNLLNNDAEVMICAHKLGDDLKFQKFQWQLEIEMTLRSQVDLTAATPRSR